MLTIPNQSSVAKAYQEFDDAGRMKPSPYYDRVVDVIEELMKFTLLTRDAAPYLVDRYSERKESAAALSSRMRHHIEGRRTLRQLDGQSRWPGSSDAREPRPAVPGCTDSWGCRTPPSKRLLPLPCHPS